MKFSTSLDDSVFEVHLGCKALFGERDPAHRSDHIEKMIEETVRIINENMKRLFLTKDGRQMAEDRVEFMRLFLDSLEEESRSARTVSGCPPSL